MFSFTAGWVTGNDGSELMGVAVLRNLTPAVQFILEQSGPVVFWRTDDWALIRAGVMPEAETVLPSINPSTLFLLFGQLPDSGAIVQHSQDMAEILPGIFVADIDPGYLESIMPSSGLKIIRLGEPFVWRTPSTSFDYAAASQEYHETVQQMADAVSGADLMADLTTLTGFQTRQSASEGCFRAGSWLGDGFRSMGYAVWEQYHVSDLAPNIIAEAQGTVYPDEIVIICGHYDSTSLQAHTLAPGADDNGTGTCAVLQAAKIMSGHSFERTIRFIAFSGEELGLLGSSAYAAAAANSHENIIGVFNFDMIGWVDRNPEDLDCISNRDSQELLDFFIDTMHMYTSLPTERVVNGRLTYSDHSPFWQQGYPAILGIEDEPLNYPYYHTIDDTADKIDVDFFTISVRAGIAAVAQMAMPSDAAAPPDPSPEDLYVQLHLNGQDYRPGQELLLTVSYENTTGYVYDVSLLVILDVYGQYWFWPSWTHAIDYQEYRLLPGEAVNDRFILGFVWPDSPVETIDGTFWSGFLDAERTRLLGGISQVEWRFSGN